MEVITTMMNDFGLTMIGLLLSSTIAGVGWFAKKIDNKVDKKLDKEDYDYDQDKFDGRLSYIEKNAVDKDAINRLENRMDNRFNRIENLLEKRWPA